MNRQKVTLMKRSRRGTKSRATGRRSPSRRSLMSAALALALLAPAAEAQRDGISVSALRQIGALLAEKASRTPAQQNISSSLLYEIKRQRTDPSLAGLPVLRSEVKADEDGMVLVDITVEVDKSLLARIERLGGRVVSHFERYDAVRAEMPLTRVEALAAWPSLRSIRPADAFMTQGTVVTEGDVAHKADQARTNLGVDGTGVNVGAMSDSVEELGAIQAAGELPAVTVLAGQSGTGTSEGTALLEIIHDMAPGSGLFYATGQDGLAQMATNIQGLATAGCDVIVDDIGYFAEGVFQDDIIAQAVETVAAQGVLYFSAAGNSGNLNDGTSGVYEGDYDGTALPAVLVGLGVSAHDFTGGGANLNEVTEPGFGIGNDAPFFTLQWSEAIGSSGDDYDLFLLNPLSTSVVAASVDVQNGNDRPFEDIDSQGVDHSNHNLVVVKVSGSDRHIHLNTHRGELFFATDGQIFGHPAAENAIAVAAVDVDDAGGAGGVFAGSESVETFSSDGPRRIFFEADGSPVPVTATDTRGIPQSSIVRDKPDVAAADGVSTTSSNFMTFFGTSASAPHAAAIAALMIEEIEQLQSAALGTTGLPLFLTVPQARGLFNSSSLDIEDPGFDRDSGTGILDANGAMNAQNIFADGFESGNTSAWTSQTP